MQWQHLELETWLWLIFAGYWFIGALTAGKTISRESLGSSLPRNLVLALAGALLFAHSLSAGILGRRFIPHSQDFYFAGVLLTAAGLGLAFWAATTWDATGVRRSHSRKATPWSAPAHTSICGIPSTPGSFWRLWARH